MGSRDQAQGSHGAGRSKLWLGCCVHHALAGTAQVTGEDAVPKCHLSACLGADRHRAEGFSLGHRVEVAVVGAVLLAGWPR